jgi:hypothetical protein
MKLANVIWPWPWRIVESGPPYLHVYTVEAANGKTIASYSDPDAQAKALVILELGAEHQISLSQTASPSNL